jgi:hypothetical protein
VIAGGRFALPLVRAQRRQRAAELVDLVQKFVKQGFNAAAYLVDHGVAVLACRRGPRS